MRVIHPLTIIWALALIGAVATAQTTCTGPIASIDADKGYILSDADGAASGQYAAFQTCSWQISCPATKPYIAISAFLGETSSTLDAVRVFSPDNKQVLVGNRTFDNPMMLWMSSARVAWSSSSGRNFNNPGWTLNYTCTRTPCLSTTSTTDPISVPATGAPVVIKSDTDGHGSVQHLKNESCVWQVSCADTAQILSVQPVQDTTDFMGYSITDLKHRTIRSEAKPSGGSYYYGSNSAASQVSAADFILDINSGFVKLEPQAYQESGGYYYGAYPEPAAAPKMASSGKKVALPNPYYYTKPPRSVRQAGITVTVKCMAVSCPTVGVTGTGPTSGQTNGTVSFYGKYTHSSTPGAVQCAKSIQCPDPDQVVSFSNMYGQTSTVDANGKVLGSQQNCYDYTNYKGKTVKSCYWTDMQYGNVTVRIDDATAAVNPSSASYAVRHYPGSSRYQYGYYGGAPKQVGADSKPASYYGTSSWDGPTQGNNINIVYTDKMHGSQYSTKFQISANWECSKKQCFSPNGTGTVLNMDSGHVALEDASKTVKENVAKLQECAWTIQCPTGKPYLFLALTSTGGNFVTNNLVLSATTTPALTLNHTAITSNATVELFPSLLHFTKQDASSYYYQPYYSSSTTMVMVDWLHLNITGRGQFGHYKADGVTKETGLPADWNASTVTPPPVQLLFNSGALNGGFADASKNSYGTKDLQVQWTCAGERCSAAQTQLTEPTGFIDNWPNRTVVPYAFGEVCQWQIRCPPGFNHINLHLRWDGSQYTQQYTEEVIEIVHPFSNTEIARMATKDWSSSSSSTHKGNDILIEGASVDIKYTAGYKGATYSYYAYSGVSYESKVPGFSGDYTCQTDRCAGQREFTASPGSITSAPGPSGIRSSRNPTSCVWSIMCASDQVVNFRKITMQSTSGYSSRSSYLMAYSVDGVEHKKWSFDGTSNARSYSGRMSYNAIQLTWENPTQAPYRAFTADYECVSGTPIKVAAQLPTTDYTGVAKTCPSSTVNASQLTGTTGKITSDADGSGSTSRSTYPESCSWDIVCPEATPYIALTTFKGETASVHDAVEFYPYQMSVADQATYAPLLHGSLEFDSSFMLHHRNVTVVWHTSSGRQFNNHGWTIEYQCLATPCAVSDIDSNGEVALPAPTSGTYGTSKTISTTSNPIWASSSKAEMMANQTCDFEFVCPIGNEVYVSDLDARLGSYSDNIRLCYQSGLGPSSCLYSAYSRQMSFFSPRARFNATIPADASAAFTSMTSSGSSTSSGAPAYYGNSSSPYYYGSTSGTGFSITAACRTLTTCSATSPTAAGSYKVSFAKATGSYACQWTASCPSGELLTMTKYSWPDRPSATIQSPYGYSYTVRPSVLYTLPNGRSYTHLYGNVFMGVQSISMSLTARSLGSASHFTYDYECAPGVPGQYAVLNQSFMGAEGGAPLKFDSAYQVYTNWINCGAPPTGQVWGSVAISFSYLPYSVQASVRDLSGNIIVQKGKYESTRAFLVTDKTALQQGLNLTIGLDLGASSSNSYYSYYSNYKWDYQCHVTQCTSPNATHQTITQTSGVIQSDSDGHGSYGSTRGADCLWTIQCPPNTVLAIDALLVTKGTQNKSTLEIFTKAGVESKTLTLSHGNQYVIPTAIDYAQIAFHNPLPSRQNSGGRGGSNYYYYSSSDYESAGFTLYYSCQSPNRVCSSANATGSVYKPTPSNTESLNKLSSSLPTAAPNSLCMWSVECPTGTFFQIVQATLEQPGRSSPRWSTLVITDRTSGTPVVDLTPQYAYGWLWTAKTTRTGSITTSNAVNIKFGVQNTHGPVNMSLQYQCSASASCTSPQSTMTALSGTIKSSAGWKPTKSYYSNPVTTSQRQVKNNCTWNVQCGNGGSFQILKMTRRMNAYTYSDSYCSYYTPGSSSYLRYCSGVDNANLLVYDATTNAKIGTIKMDGDSSIYKPYRESYTTKRGLKLPKGFSNVRLSWSYMPTYHYEGWELEYLCTVPMPTNVPTLTPMPTQPQTPSPTLGDGCPVHSSTARNKKSGFVGYRKNDPIPTHLNGCKWSISACATTDAMLMKRVEKFPSPLYKSSMFHTFVEGVTRSETPSPAGATGPSNSIHQVSTTITTTLQKLTVPQSPDFIVTPSNIPYIPSPALDGSGAGVAVGARYSCTGASNLRAKLRDVTLASTMGALVVVSETQVLSRRQTASTLETVSFSEANTSSLILSCSDASLSVSISSVYGQAAASTDKINFFGTAGASGTCTYVPDTAATTNLWKTTDSVCAGAQLVMNYGSSSATGTGASVYVDYTCVTEAQVDSQVSAATPAEQSQDVPTAVIVGSSVAAVVIAIIIVAIVIVLCARRSSDQKKRQAAIQMAQGACDPHRTADWEGREAAGPDPARPESAHSAVPMSEWDSASKQNVEPTYGPTGGIEIDDGFQVSVGEPLGGQGSALTNSGVEGRELMVRDEVVVGDERLPVRRTVPKEGFSTSGGDDDAGMEYMQRKSSIASRGSIGSRGSNGGADEFLGGSGSTVDDNKVELRVNEDE